MRSNGSGSTISDGKPKRLLVLDPAILSSTNSTAPLKDGVLRSRRHLAVPVTVSAGCYGRLLANQPNSSMNDGGGDDYGTAVAFGSAQHRTLAPRLLGYHVSDSGLSAIIDCDDLGNDEVDGEVDEDEGNDDNDKDGNSSSLNWKEFVMGTLSMPEVSQDRESFPPLLWFGRVPLGGTAMAVYGVPSQPKDLAKNHPDPSKIVHDTLVLRALDKDDDDHVY
jgi:hypothetical protein